MQKSNNIAPLVLIGAFVIWFALATPIVESPTYEPIIVTQIELRTLIGDVRVPIDRLDRGPWKSYDEWEPNLKAYLENAIPRYIPDPSAKQTVIDILWCESEGKWWAVSPTGCTGLFQFCTDTWRMTPQAMGYGERSNPYDNIDAALWLMSESYIGGFVHWECWDDPLYNPELVGG